MPSQLWSPPNSLSGKFWQLQVLHVKGHWAPYVEYKTVEDAVKDVLWRQDRNYITTGKFRVMGLTR